MWCQCVQCLMLSIMRNLICNLSSKATCCQEVMTCRLQDVCTGPVTDDAGGIYHAHTQGPTSSARSYQLGGHPRRRCHPFSDGYGNQVPQISNDTGVQSYRNLHTALPRSAMSHLLPVYCVGRYLRQRWSRPQPFQQQRQCSR